MFFILTNCKIFTDTFKIKIVTFKIKKFFTFKIKISTFKIKKFFIFKIKIITDTHLLIHNKKLFFVKKH